MPKEQVNTQKQYVKVEYKGIEPIIFTGKKSGKNYGLIKKFKVFYIQRRDIDDRVVEV